MDWISLPHCALKVFNSEQGSLNFQCSVEFEKKNVINNVNLFKIKLSETTTIFSYKKKKESPQVPANLPD